jgi:lantibiotic modifying enzyme
MEALCEEYPVLARLLGTAFELWKEDLDELFRRLNADLPTLARVFNDGEPLGEIVEIECSLSDPHHGGRTVRRITFASGVKVLYKPRNLGIDQAWSNFLSWVNDRSGLLQLWSPRLAVREHYGWVENVPEAAPGGPAAVQRFYERAGMLVCLTYVLQGSDFHRENVLASGEHPVLIDVESILVGQIRSGDPMERLQSVYGQRFRSVMSSGLLPRWVPVENGKSRQPFGNSSPRPRPTSPCSRA